MSKPREWILYPQINIDMIVANGPSLDSNIVVIEKSAYEALKAELKTLHAFGSYKVDELAQENAKLKAESYRVIALKLLSCLSSLQSVYCNSFSAQTHNANIELISEVRAVLNNEESK